MGNHFSKVFFMFCLLFLLGIFPLKWDFGYLVRNLTSSNWQMIHFPWHIVLTHGNMGFCHLVQLNHESTYYYCMCGHKHKTLSLFGSKVF